MIKFFTALSHLVFLTCHFSYNAQVLSYGRIQSLTIEAINAQSLEHLLCGTFLDDVILLL